ncbi:MAG: GDP-fucose synthetase [Bacteroidetes bacterium MED-G20]|nr:MAG: GDP-fucose synthetase [Bacteroidetes bacterium MED-G20]
MSFSHHSKIYIAGHNGMVGSAISRKLKSLGYHNLITKSSKELDLRNQKQTQDFFKNEQPEFVFLAAAKVGGILANSSYKADFIYDNLMIQNNVIKSAHYYSVKKLLFLGSSCIYPRDASQPIKEEYLLSGYLESTNEPYAIAKIAGLKMCEYFREQYGCNFISAMPSNVYGPNDNFEPKTSHVFAALIKKFHDAIIHNQSKVEIWGSGSPKREFLHVDDLANALIFLMKKYHSKETINIGTGQDISIKELSYSMQNIIGFNGELEWNTSMPDGTAKKLLDVSKINNLGWKADIKLNTGIALTYDWYTKNLK